MIDIVERLRTHNFPIGRDDIMEAAAEIERLREDNDQMRAQLTTRSGYQYVSSVQEMSDGLTMQRHEIERLREELADVRADAALLRAEIEMLRT